MNRKLRSLSIMVFGGVLLACLSGCNTGQKTNDDAVKQKALVSTSDTSSTRIVKLNNTLFSVPSPYQAAIFIKKQGVPYSKNYLNDVQKTSSYDGSFYAAVNLGVFGADMGYITLYEQSPDAMTYFSVIKMLAEKLELLGAFDRATIERIESNINNQDSLLTILGDTYRNADSYFKDNEREHLAGLVIAGGWVESMYLLVNIADASSAESAKRIGENKKPLDNLIQLLAPYAESSSQYKKLVDQLIELAGIYEQVHVDYEFITTETNPDKKLTTVKAKTNIKIEQAVVKEIAQQLNKIRTFIVRG
ncbi:MAG: hypothetical protein R6U85_03435 [Salinivirgaceae bacterium]